jgi:drug/metabolite transporter (DMT)-like permease
MPDLVQLWAYPVGAAPLSAGVLAVVILAGLLHAAWNAVAHYIPDRRVGLALIAVAYTVVAGPLTLVCDVPPVAAWPWLVASGIIHVGYGFCLLRSYRLGDFGQTYPLARAVAPLLVVAIGATALQQHLEPHSWFGLALLCGGILLVAVSGRGGSDPSSRAATTAALATGVLIAAYTVVDGVGVGYVPNAVDYVVWMFALQGPLTLFALAAMRGPVRLAADCRPYLGLGTASGVVSLLAYGAVIWAQGQAEGNTGIIAATREVGIVFAAFIGRIAFREQLGPMRVSGAGAALAGIVVLNLT